MEDKAVQQDTVTMTTLDVLMPQYNRRMVEQTFVQRRPPQTFEAFRHVRPADMPLATWLSAARTMFRRDRLAEKRPLWDLLQDVGWITLLEDPPHEVVIGLVGKVWHLDFGVHPVADRAEFLEFERPGYVKIALSYRFVPQYAGTRIVCESRVRATDAEAAHHFERYWTVIGIGAHLTTRSGLRAIKRRAERGVARRPRATRVHL